MYMNQLLWNQGHGTEADLASLLAVYQYKDTCYRNENF